jgi:hypothetical protein
MFVILLLLAAGVALGPGGPRPAPPAPRVEAPAAAPWPYFQAPDHITLCHDPVPLDDPEVREDLDREFTIAVWSRAQTTMWIKRGQRYFPEIERRIRAYGLPLDLKYVAVIESNLMPKARSSVGALGPWQFMGPTAKRFQLQANDALDERMNFTAATDAALRYLRDLHRLFRNWPLALAAYNCGEGRVQKEMALQGVSNYYHLSLPEETERYLYRILAAKIILESPGRYGYDIPPEKLYPPLDFDEVDFSVAKEVAVRTLAEACGSNYKSLKRLNPWIKGAALPPGAYHLKIPKGSASRFREAYRRGGFG